MRNDTTPLMAFLADEDGTTSVEYAVVLMLILFVVIGAVQFFAASLQESFDESAKALNETG